MKEILEKRVKRRPTQHHLKERHEKKLHDA